MRMRGFARKRSFAVAAIVLALAVAAPELAAPAGALAARSTNRTELQARPAVRSALAAKKRKVRRARKVKPLTAAQRKARLTTYLKAHPGVVAKKLGVAPKKPLKKKPAKAKKGKKRKPAKRKPLTAAAKRRAAAAAAKRRRAAALVAKRKRNSGAAKTKKAAKKHALGTTGWTELLLLALLPFGAVGGVLLGTDRVRRPREPRAPSPSKRRRTLVITPMKGRR
jgi:hypothetical protein